MVINRNKVKAYIKELNPKLQIQPDCYMAIDEQIRAIIRIGIKRNGSHRRIYSENFVVVDPLKGR